MKKDKKTKIIVQDGIPLMVPENFKPKEQKLRQDK